MKKYVILIANRYDSYDRYWVTRRSLEEANDVANEYEKDNNFHTEIYEISECQDLRD